MGGVWNMLSLEQLRQLSDEEVTQRVNERLFPLGTSVRGAFVEPADFLAAQYYVNELDRREKRRADEERDAIETERWRTDLRYERWIVALIIVEVILAGFLTWWTDDRQSKAAQMELEALQSVQQVLSHLEDSSKATADTMKAERQIMEGMKASLDKQVGLFYDVQLNLIYNQGTKKLVLINSGRGNVTVWAQELGPPDSAFITYPKEVVISPGNTLETPVDAMLKKLSGIVAKDGNIHYTFAYLVKNEKGEKFTFAGDVYGAWKNDEMYFNTLPSEIVPGWKR
jgi:hypothetical protein